MSESADPLLMRLTEQGVLSPDDLTEVRAAFQSDEQTMDGSQLAGELVGLKKLTTFQAQTICDGDLEKLIIGNYVILEELGRGGMGHVYKARHRDMDRVVALKVLPPERVSSQAGLRRFRQEVKAAARLVHPNIVTAFDADVSGGLPYLVMEYVRGQDLQAHLAQHGPLSVTAAVDCILQTARGLEYAHRVGVIHRDIKPANLLLDENGVVRVLDMGVAQLQQHVRLEDQSHSTQITRDGAVIGTADFMSPEQASNPHDADARSDIYSLGCTLYFLLTNAPVYGGDSVVDRLIAHRQLPIPSLREACPDVPAALDEVFFRMVAKDPSDRFPSISALTVELESVHRDLETLPLRRMRSRNREMQEAAPRRSWLTFFLLVALLITLLGTGGFYYYDNYMPGEGTIEIDVDQAGANILVGNSLEQGRIYGPTAGNLLTLELPRGDYQLQIGKPGYITKYRQLKLRPWQTQRVTIQMTKQPESLNVFRELINAPADKGSASEAVSGPSEAAPE